MIKNIAVILTVFNRKEITLSALNSLYRAIMKLGDGYIFNIYMTDDGSSDGTTEFVLEQFPNIKIIKGNGQLYWGGGMRAAWRAAIESGVLYDYFLWFNDDAELYDDALITLFKVADDIGEKCLVSGSFCDMEGKTSYGGRDKDNVILTPNGKCQEILLMNGNLVLVSNYIYKELGFIDKHFPHGLGDWDYGLRAIKKGMKVYLTPKNVGVTERHDNEILFHRCELSIRQKIKYLYSPKYSVIASFRFKRRHMGLYRTVLSFIATHLYVLFPFLYNIRTGHKSSK